MRLDLNTDIFEGLKLLYHALDGFVGEGEDASLRFRRKGDVVVTVPGVLERGARDNEAAYFIAEPLDRFDGAKRIFAFRRAHGDEYLLVGFAECSYFGRPGDFLIDEAQRVSVDGFVREVGVFDVVFRREHLGKLLFLFMVELLQPLLPFLLISELRHCSHCIAQKGWYRAFVETKNVAEFEAEAARFASRLAPGTGGATIVALSGPLGVGKTTFARAVLRFFGVEEHVTSPTFVIEKVYEPAKGSFRRVVHIDAYRLKSARELDVLGWNELMASPETLILMEWPEQVPGALPESAIRIALKYSSEHEREIAYEEETAGRS